MKQRRWLVTGLAAGAVGLLALFAAGPEPTGPAAAGDRPPGEQLGADGTVAASPTSPVAPTTTTAPPTTTTTTTFPPSTTTTRPPEVGSDSCRLSGEHEPQGTRTAVTGETGGGDGTVWDVRVEIEDGLSIDPECFGDAVIDILSDSRGWGRDGSMSFRRTDGDVWDFRLVLGSPDLVDRLCAPINTGGEFSCRNGNVVAINLDRWELGAAPFGDDRTTYRQYLINHEVGHRLGHAHVTCPGPGLRAPVMMQQSKSTGACDPNGWPLDDEL